MMTIIILENIMIVMCNKTQYVTASSSSICDNTNTFFSFFSLLFFFFMARLNVTHDHIILHKLVVLKSYNKLNPFRW